MRVVSWMALVSLGALGAAGAEEASAQSLAEIAKKEKERRAQEDEPVPVVGARELEAARGDRLSVMGAAPEPQDDEAQATDGDASEGEASESPTRRSLSASEVKRYRETWARVWAERLEAAEEELVLAKDAVFQCNSASHYVFVPLAIDCTGAHERLAIAQYRVRELRQNQYNWELLLPERERAPPRD